MYVRRSIISSMFFSGLTDTEIEYAFKIIPQKGNSSLFRTNLHSFLIETSQALVPAHRPSFLRRIISDVVFAGLIAFAYQIFQRWFRSVGDDFSSPFLDRTVLCR